MFQDSQLEGITFRQYNPFLDPSHPIICRSSQPVARPISCQALFTQSHLLGVAPLHTNHFRRHSPAVPFLIHPSSWLEQVLASGLADSHLQAAKPTPSATLLLGISSPGELLPRRTPSLASFAHSHQRGETPPQTNPFPGPCPSKSSRVHPGFWLDSYLPSPHLLTLTSKACLLAKPTVRRPFSIHVIPPSSQLLAIVNRFLASACSLTLA